MNFIKQILSSLIPTARGRARRLAVCALLIAAAVASLTYFQPRRARAQQTSTILQGAAAIEQLKQDGQYESLKAAMDQTRFSVNRAAHTPLGHAAWHAPNAAAGYDAYVTESGVSIAVNDEAYVSLSLHSLGYGTAMQAVAPGEVSGAGQTIDIAREGGVREWFVNGPDGLEHGFTLAEPLGTRQQGTPLRLALQVGAGWRAVAGEDGGRVTLRGANDQAVEYGKLVVRDSEGRIIPARLAVANEQVVIEVEDHDAAYPLTIDPLFTLQQRLTAADGAAFDYLGFAVALDGDTALVGAPYDAAPGVEQGSAYIFVRNGATWTQQAKLSAQDGAAGDMFGYAVALDGKTALVGAPFDDAALADEGSAYVFVRNGTKWTQQARLSASGGLGGALFGAAVALRGGTVLVGAYQQTITPSFDVTGAAYVFVRNGANWTQQARLLANDAHDNDRFGFRVALEADTALISAPSDSVGTNTSQGSAYVFTRNGAAWTQQTKLTAGDGAAYDYFGYSVAFSGDTAVVGAYGDDNASVVDQGAAYVFTRSGLVWTQQQKLFAGDGAAYDLFGNAVAISGDTVLVGSYGDDIGANGNQGSVYVFARGITGSGAVWTLQQKLTASDGAPSDLFGNAVALSGNTMLAGAYADDSGVNQNQGSVYVFVR